MHTRQVSLDWLEAVRDLLYEVAHQPSSIGQRAEALGQSMPEILAAKPSDDLFTDAPLAGVH